MTAKTKADIINEEVGAIAAELTAAGFTPQQINALYHAMHRVVVIKDIEDTDPRVFEGDDGGY